MSLARPAFELTPSLQNSANTLLQHVINADWDVVAKLIDENPELMFVSAEAVDVTNNVIHMTPVHYALSVHDVHMQQQFENCAIKHKLVEKYLQHARERYQEFDFKPYRNVFRDLLQLLKQHKQDKSITKEELDAFWREIVGGAQRYLLPRHLLKQMCDDDGCWSYCYEFDIKNLPQAERGVRDDRSRSHQAPYFIYPLNFDTPGSVLGVDIALGTVDGNESIRASSGLTDYAREAEYVRDDIETFKHLIATRKRQQQQRLDALEKSLQSKSQLATVRKFCHAFFDIDDVKEAALMQSAGFLMGHVMNGEREKAEKLLENVKAKFPNDYHRLILDDIGWVESHNNRVWLKTSPLKFAAWAGDLNENPDQMYMVNMLLKYVPPQYKHQSAEQLEEVLTKGTEHGKFMSPIADTIQVFNDYIKHYDDRHPQMLNRISRYKIGGSQKLWTVYMFQEMWREIEWPCRTDKKDYWQCVVDFYGLPEVPRTECVLKYHNYEGDKSEPMFPLDDLRLGFAYALEHIKGAYKSDYGIERINACITRAFLLAIRHYKESMLWNVMSREKQFASEYDAQLKAQSSSISMKI